MGSFGIISTVTNPFCDQCNRIRITADGKIKNCLFSNNEIDLLTPLRNGKEINHLIKKLLLSKKLIRSGMEASEVFENFKKHEKNRSMIAIVGWFFLLIFYNFQEYQYHLGHHKEFHLHWLYIY